MEIKNEAHNHGKEAETDVRASEIEPIGNEFFGLVTQGKRLITGGGFSPLRE